VSGFGFIPPQAGQSGKERNVAPRFAANAARNIENRTLPGVKRFK
jgi:hypothetical protein